MDSISTTNELAFTHNASSYINSSGNSISSEEDSTQTFSEIPTSNFSAENTSSLQQAWSENESSILYNNADALSNKRDELESLITINKYDIVRVGLYVPCGHPLGKG